MKALIVLLLVTFLVIPPILGIRRVRQVLRLPPAPAGDEDERA